MKHTDAIQANTAALGELADTIRPRDFNGFTPDPAEDGNPEANAKQDGSTLLTNPYPPGDDRNVAWFQGMTDALIYIASLNVARMNAILERRPAP